VKHPDDEALAGIALGEEPAADTAEHLRGCRTCSDAVVALRDTVTALRAPAPGTVAPPASVWAAVEAELDAHPDSDRAPGLQPDAVPDDLARQRAARADRGARGGRRAFPVAWVAGAAAAGLVIGVLGTRAVADGDGDGQGRRTVTVASTSLDTLDTQQVKGTADVVRQSGRLDLTVSTQPIDPDGGYLEVWLINKDLSRMVSVGVLEPDERSQSFTIPQELLDEGYVIVDISREGFDDAPQHSGDSVVRGTLAT